MHYQTEHALSQARMDDAMPIRCTKYDKNGYYHLRGANGEKRVIAAGTANTAWANAEWPRYGKWAVLWAHAREDGQPASRA